MTAEIRTYASNATTAKLEDTLDTSTDVSDPETVEGKREESRQVGERTDAMELSKELVQSLHVIRHL